MKNIWPPIQAMKKGIAAIVLFLLGNLSVHAQQPCDIIYVSPGAANATGFSNDPTNLIHALTLVSGNRQFVRMEEGTYSITQIVNLTTNVKIEGGYRIDAGGNWIKRSDASTSINFSGFEVQNMGAPFNVNVGHNIGFKADGVNNWSLQDLVISVAAASGTTDDRGNSAYGVYINGCNNYSITRCVVFAGAGSPGSDGLGALPGYDPANDPYDGFTGSGSQVGGGGDCDDDNLDDGNYSGSLGIGHNGNGGFGGAGAGVGFGLGSGIRNFSPTNGGANGGAGDPATSLRAGGGGASGGAGGSEANTGGEGGRGGAGGGGAAGGNVGSRGTLFGCNCSIFGCSSDCGTDGGNAGAGTAGTDGVNGPDGTAGVFDLFYVPGGKATDGTDGHGGAGGGGGGGGGGQGGLGIDGAGGGGGGGGGGGQGGAGGTGGFGGGTSVGIYSVASTGIVTDCSVLSGTAGVGGTGGTGGIGGDGGAGAQGGANNCGITNDETGDGGVGGNGGKGGDGGNGGNGQDGFSYPLYDDVQGVSAGTSVPTPGIITVDYNNGAACTNSEITITKQSGTWLLPVAADFIEDLGPGNSSYNASSPTAVVSFTNVGPNNIGINSGIFTNYITITENRPLPVFSTLIPTTLCTGETIDLATTTGADTYEWVVYLDSAGPNAPFADFNIQNPGTVGPFTTTGSYTIRIRTFTECCGWSVPVYEEFSVSETPTVDAGADKLICAGDTTTLSVTGTGANYFWSTTETGTSIDVSPNSSTNYTVIALNSSGCTASDTVRVDVSRVTINIDSTRDVGCNGDTTGAIFITAAGNARPLDYLWSDGAVTEDLTGVGANIYQVSVTDTNNCTTVAQAIVAQPSDLFSVIVVDRDVSCNGGSDGALTLFVTGGTQPYTFMWSDTNSNQNRTGLSAGQYEVTVTDGNGCVSISTSEVTQPSQLTATPSITNISCFGANDGIITIIAGGGTPPFSYNWSIGGPSVATRNNLSPGSYQVTLTDTNNCSVNLSVNITSPLLLEASGIATPADCSTGGLGTAAVTTTGGTLPYQYNWNTSPVDMDSIAEDVRPGAYTVIVIDGNGCTASETVDIITTGTFSLTVAATETSCAEVADGTATANIAGGSPPFDYVWSTTPTQLNQTATNLGVGVYVVTVTDQNGCADSASVSIAADTDNPLVIDVETEDIGCVGALNGEASAIVSGGQGPYTYEWNTDPVQTTSSITGLAPGGYQITITDENGCDEVLAFTINQQPELEVTLSDFETIIDIGTAFEVEAFPSRGGDFDYAWSPADGLNVADSNIVVASPSSPTTYVVVITEVESGCTATDSIFILAANDYAVPNVFTPNGDGLNDGFGILIREDATLMEFQIYNRWGEMIFDKVNEKWDGTYKDTKQPAGVYIYKGIVKRGNGEEILVNGDVTLIR